METVIQSTEDQLIPALTFSLPKSAKYLIDRKSVTFWPTGSNIYKTTSGTKVIKFQLNSQDWIDPSSVRIMFDLVNNDPHAALVPVKYVRPLSGPHSFFRRLRISCGGTLVEDFDYNRTHQMFQIMTSSHNRENDDIEGFGYRSDTVAPNANHTVDTLPGIPSGSKQTVGFKLLSGLLNQPKFLPLKYMGNLTIELELVMNANDPVVTPGVAEPAGVFTTTNTTNDWSIENVQLKCDVVTLDSGLQNNYDEHVLNGGKLPIHYNTYITQQQAVSGTDISVNVSRAITRLKSIFVTFYKAPAQGTERAENKEWLDFVHPMNNSATYNSNYELEIQAQIGSKLLPEYPVRSVSESFAQLKKSMGIMGSNFHSMSITPVQYRNEHFVFGIDCEKALGVGYTGINSRSGDLLTIRAKALDKTVLDGKMPTQMHILLHSDQMLEIADNSSTVFD